MTTTNRAIWSDAYRIMERYENIPPGSYDDNRDYWDGMNRDQANLYSKFQNDSMAWHLGYAIHTYIDEQYKAVRMASNGSNNEMQHDADHQLFAQQEALQKPTEEQIRMDGVDIV